MGEAEGRGGEWSAEEEVILGRVSFVLPQLTMSTSHSAFIMYRSMLICLDVVDCSRDGQRFPPAGCLSGCLLRPMKTLLRRGRDNGHCRERERDHGDSAHCSAWVSSFMN
jgi:hypothetical protein